MTNLEYWKDRILEILESYCLFGLKNGYPTECCHIECKNCDLYEDKTHYCNRKRFEWLCSEHEEKPKLTKRERKLCELLETGWIAADEDGSIYWYPYIPTKRNVTYYCEKHMCLSNGGFNFAFMKFEDEEPWMVENLLQLEVEE